MHPFLPILASRSPKTLLRAYVGVGRLNLTDVTCQESACRSASRVFRLPATTRRISSQASGRPPSKSSSKSSEASKGGASSSAENAKGEETSHYDDLTLPIAFPGSSSGSGGAEGSGLFPFSRSAFVDAALTTIIGLGMGELGQSRGVCVLKHTCQYFLVVLPILLGIRKTCSGR